MAVYAFNAGQRLVHEILVTGVGDIRGGISIIIPALPYITSAKSIRLNMIMIHMVILVLGVFVLSLFDRFRSNQEKKIEEKNRELREKIEENEYTTKIERKKKIEAVVYDSLITTRFQNHQYN